MSKYPDTSVSLNYIDKLYQHYMQGVRNCNFSLLIELVFCALLLSFIFGFVSVDKNYQFMGINFQVTIWFILIGGSLIINSLYFYTIHMFKGNRALRRDIVSTYKELGIKFSDQMSLPFNDSIIKGLFYTIEGEETMMNQPNVSKLKYFPYLLSNFILITFVLFIFLILPFITTVFGLYKFILLTHFNFASEIAAFISIVISISSFVSFFYF